MNSGNSIMTGETASIGVAEAPEDPAHESKMGSAKPEAPGGRRVIEVACDAPVRRAIDVGWIRTQLIAAADHISAPVRHVNIRIVSDDAMRELHRRHSGIDETTDVLTFPHAEPGRPIEADIAVCADEAARPSAELGHSIERELLLYALHGLLHCAGFDDHDPAAHDSMHAEEDRILALIGVGATFARPVPPSLPGSGVGGEGAQPARADSVSDMPSPRPSPEGRGSGEPISPEGMGGDR